MKRSKYSESQIVGILKEADAGMQVKEICRKYGVSDAWAFQNDRCSVKPRFQADPSLGWDAILGMFSRFRGC